MKSSDDFWQRMKDDPEFRQEMIEQQRNLGSFKLPQKKRSDVAVPVVR
jgi:hypothetical protein